MPWDDEFVDENSWLYSKVVLGITGSALSS